MTIRSSTQSRAATSDASEEHEFGGPWTKLKLDIVDRYLAAWLKALSKQRFTQVYVDAFAGSGRIALREGGERIAGSAERVLRQHAFDRYLFIDKNKRRVKQLQALAEGLHKTQHTSVFLGDANRVLMTSLPELSQANTRGVIFLDPYGLQLAWETLAAIARTGTMDVWYLFPLSGFYRQAARSYEGLDADKRAALDRLLGPCEWRSDLYAPANQLGLFETLPDERSADATALQTYAKHRLETIFPAVADPLMLRGPNRAPLFSLFLCVSNPNRNAQGIAMRIARHLLRH